MTSRMQQRRDTAANWTSNNPTLAAGELGFETNTGKFKIGTGALAWTALLYAGGGQSTLTTYQYTATASQTTFSGADSNALTLAYTVGAIQVYLNGALLANTTDYAATTGTSVVLSTGADVGDSLTILSLATFQVANTYTQAQSDALFIPDAIVDAKGDLIAATAADTVSRLAVGANNTVLTADSAEATGMKWAAASGGGMTVIASGTMSSTSLLISSIPSTYTDLVLELDSFFHNVANWGWSLRLNDDNNANRYFNSRAFATVSTGTAFNASQIELTFDNGGINSASSGKIRALIPSYAVSTSWKMVQAYGVQQVNLTPADFYFQANAGLYNQTAAISSLRIVPNTGATIGGQYVLYGVK